MLDPSHETPDAKKFPSVESAPVSCLLTRLHPWPMHSTLHSIRDVIFCVALPTISPAIAPVSMMSVVPSFPFAPGRISCSQLGTTLAFFCPASVTGQRAAFTAHHPSIPLDGTQERIPTQRPSDRDDFPSKIEGTLASTLSMTTMRLEQQGHSSRTDDGGLSFTPDF